LKNIAIVSINEVGFDASKRLSKTLLGFETTNFNREFNESPSFVKYEKLDDILDELFKFDAIIFLLATGIVVRKIAPFLKSKELDPAILIINFELNRVIPLLSGHLGGANELAEIICSKIDGSINFITTATDQKKVFAFDNFAKKNGFKIHNIGKLANISNRLIDKKPIRVLSFDSIFQTISKDTTFEKSLFKFETLYQANSENLVIISPQYINTDSLFLQIQKINLGLGMNRGVELSEVEEAIYSFLFEHNLSFSQIDSISTFRAKADEDALLSFVQKHSIELKIFDEDEINSLKDEFTPSQATKFFGIKGVAEPTALLGSNYKELFLKKHIYGNITIAGGF
jgi:cobalt-precorrin 5A hydrolase